jgi:hypothetical protein
MKLLIGLLLLTSQAAFADAYYTCKTPSVGGVAIGSYSDVKKGNVFVLNLTPNMPIVATLGLATTQNYTLRGLFEGCESSNPHAAHASYCFSGAGGVDVTAVGDTDGSLAHLHYRGMSIKAIDVIQQTPWTSRALVTVQIIFDLEVSKSATANMAFEVPLPDAKPGTPSQCN